MGDRIVYHVSPEHTLDGNALDKPTLSEPSQSVDDSSRPAKHDKLQGELEGAANSIDDIDQQVNDMNNHDSNALDDEQTDKHPKNTKGKKNGSDNLHATNELLVILTGIMILVNFNLNKL